jgi:ATP-dependent helicase YprA (DUF1998 family)
MVAAAAMAAGAVRARRVEARRWRSENWPFLVHRMSLVAIAQAPLIALAALREAGGRSATFAMPALTQGF